MKKSDLEEVIREAIARILLKPEPEPKQTLTIDEAVKYCADKGFNISKSTIYKHTMDGTIPFRRFGQKKIVFDRYELDGWIEKRVKKII